MYDLTPKQEEIFEILSNFDGHGLVITEETLLIEYIKEYY